MVNDSLAYRPEGAAEGRADERPLKWCSVSLAEVTAAGKRLDATMFDMELKAARQALRELPVEKRAVAGKDGLCTAYRPGICKRIFVEKSDRSVGMLTPSQVTDVYPRAEKYLSANMRDEIADWYVQDNEILLTCSGTIGKTALVTKTLSGQCVSQNLIRLVAKDAANAGYVYAYLTSRTGQLFLTRNNYGAVIQHIDPGHLEKIPIPVAPAELRHRIHELILRSYQLRDKSNELIDEANRLLVQALRLPRIEELSAEAHKQDAPVETFDVKLSAVSGRLDASYHVPLVDAIIRHLRRYAREVATVGDSRVSKAIILPGRFKRVYVEEGRGRIFIGGKQLYELDPSNKKYLSVARHGERIAKQLELHENMTLITCSGTIGKVALVGRHWEKWTANQHIIRVVPASEDIAGYIYIFLSSPYGYPLITRFTYGAVIDEIDDTHVGQIPIPLLADADAQRRINELALQANEKRYEAYKTEQEALDILDRDVLRVGQTG